MFNKIFKRPCEINQHLNAPLLEDRLRYLAHRAEQGIAKSGLCRMAHYQLILIKYLPLEEGRLITLEEIKSSAKIWSKHKMGNLYIKDSYHFLYKCRKFITHAKLWLHFLGRIKIPIKPVPAQIIEFDNYTREEKGLCETTICRNGKVLQYFFSQIKEDPSKFLAHLTPAHLDEILVQKLRQGIYARSTIQLFVTVLRSFLRYAEHHGWCRSGIADSIQSPRIYKHETLPSSPSWEDVQRLIKTTEKGDRPSNIRDRAIILLLAVYGFRDSEVRQFRLEDFDWEKQIIHLKHSKLGPTQTFPLVEPVGQALVRYIKESRPRNSIHREIFLTIHPPFRPLDNLNSLVYNRWKPLNVDIKYHGPHSLRHACATRLINQGVPLKTIADQLGHRSLESTRIYAKVDLTRLREISNFNMGGLS